MPVKCDIMDKDNKELFMGNTNRIRNAVWIRDSVASQSYNERNKEFANAVAARRKANCFTPDLPMVEARRGHLLFVYGTLKINFSRHHILKKMKAKYVGQAITSHMHSLYRTKGENPFPVLLPQRSRAPGGIVVGQLFIVYPRTIQILDEIEQNGHMFQRVSSTIQCTSKPEHDDFQLYGSYRAWMYMGLMPYWNKHITTTDAVEPIYPYKDASGGNTNFLYFKEWIGDDEVVHCC